MRHWGSDFQTGTGRVKTQIQKPPIRKNQTRKTRRGVQSLGHLCNKSSVPIPLIPGYSPLPKKKARKTLRAAKSVQPAPRVAALHPYDLGRAVAQKMRLDVPRNEICEGIRASLQNEAG
jgi:hypothetical protein